jgi:hypothetical protein
LYNKKEDNQAQSKADAINARKDRIFIKPAQANFDIS